MNYQFNDGGRAAAGYRDKARDCATRAIAIATCRPYREIYVALTEAARRDADHATRRRRRNHPRNGLSQSIVHGFLEGLGWCFTPTVGPARRPRMRLRPQSLPPGRLIVALSRQVCAVIDGVIHDTYDCSRGGTRLVYGYYVPVSAEPPAPHT